MTKRKESPLKSSPAWDRLAAKYPDHPALTDDAIYALPRSLIEAICNEPERTRYSGGSRSPTRRHASFFTAEEKTFELDLAAAAGQGFFLKHPFSCRLLPASAPAVVDSKVQEIQKQHERSAAQIETLRRDLLLSSGRTPREIEEHFNAEADLEQQIVARQRGYVGWLATHPDFHRSRAILRERWDGRVRERPGFEPFPASFVEIKPMPSTAKDREFYADWIPFYRRWSLDTFVTWELPMPMRPDVTVPSLKSLLNVGDSGVVLFIPWYLLVDRRLDLREIAEMHRVNYSPDHLSEWIDGGPKGWGYERFGIMLQMYVYFELALKRRYGPGLRTWTERLDVAFARFLGGEDATQREIANRADSNRKIRLELAKRLRRCRDAVE